MNTDHDTAAEPKDLIWPWDCPRRPQPEMRRLGWRDRLRRWWRLKRTGHQPSAGTVFELFCDGEAVAFGIEFPSGQIMLELQQSPSLLRSYVDRVAMQENWPGMTVVHRATVRHARSSEEIRTKLSHRS